MAITISKNQPCLQDTVSQNGCPFRQEILCIQVRERESKQMAEQTSWLLHLLIKRLPHCLISMALLMAWSSCFWRSEEHVEVETLPPS